MLTIMEFHNVIYGQYKNKNFLIKLKLCGNLPRENIGIMSS